MANLPSTFAKMNDVEIAPDAPVTEALHKKLGQNDNYLYDALNTEITNRTNADSALQTQINTIKNEINTKLVRVPVRAFAGTYNPGTNIGADQLVSAIWFEKRLADNKSFLAVQVFNDDGDDMLLDLYHELPHSPTAWDYGAWYFDQDSDTVYWSLYNDLILSIP